MTKTARGWRRLARAAAAATIALVLVGFGLHGLMNARTFQLFGRLVASAPRADKVVALTLDDGPTPERTEAVLALLQARGVHATFFVNGQPLRQHPELGRRLVSAGHQLGNHGDTHARLVFRSAAFIRREIEATDEAIRAAGVTGEIPFRPPYGKKLLSLPWFLRRTGRVTVMWTLEPESTPGVPHTAEAEAAFVVEHATPGAIILMHAMFDPQGQALRAIDAMITGLTGAGYRFVTVDELLRAPAAAGAARPP